MVRCAWKRYYVQGVSTGLWGAHVGRADPDRFLARHGKTFLADAPKCRVHRISCALFLSAAGVVVCGKRLHARVDRRSLGLGRPLDRHGLHGRLLHPGGAGHNDDLRWVHSDGRSKLDDWGKRGSEHDCGNLYLYYRGRHCKFRLHPAAARRFYVDRERHMEHGAPDDPWLYAHLRCLSVRISEYNEVPIRTNHWQRRQLPAVLSDRDRRLACDRH